MNEISPCKLVIITEILIAYINKKNINKTV